MYIQQNATQLQHNKPENLAFATNKTNIEMNMIKERIQKPEIHIGTYRPTR